MEKILYNLTQEKGLFVVSTDDNYHEMIKFFSDNNITLDKTHDNEVIYVYKDLHGFGGECYTLKDYDKHYKSGNSWAHISWKDLKNELFGIKDLIESIDKNLEILENKFKN